MRHTGTSPTTDALDQREEDRMPLYGGPDGNGPIQLLKSDASSVETKAIALEPQQHNAMARPTGGPVPALAAVGSPTSVLVRGSD